MKKRSILLLPLIVLGMSLAACHGKTSTNTNSNNNNTGNQTVTNVTYTLTNTNNWDVFVDNAKVYANVSGGNYGSGQWIACTKASSTSLNFTCDSTATTCKIVRFNPSNFSAPDWNGQIWNQSSEISLNPNSTSINYAIG